jgi:para-nitrobenzyl esterase
MSDLSPQEADATLAHELVHALQDQHFDLKRFSEPIKDDGDRQLADTMSSYWVNFARTGNPNGAGLPQWQAHQAGASERAMILDADPASERLPDKARLMLLDRLYERMQHAAH